MISVPVYLKELLATASTCTSPEKIFNSKSWNQDIDKNVKTEHSKRNSGKKTPAVAIYQCTECTALDDAFKKI